MKALLTFALVAVITATLVAATISATTTTTFAKPAPNSKGCDSGEKDEGAPEKCSGEIVQDPPDNDGDFNP